MANRFENFTGAELKMFQAAVKRGGCTFALQKEIDEQVAWYDSLPKLKRPRRYFIKGEEGWEYQKKR